MESPIFAVIGHGNEEPLNYGARLPVPSGTTVITLTKPGQPFSEDDAKRMWESMYEDPIMFNNPVANKGEIERLTQIQMRIYEAGTPMPPLRFSPESHFQTREVGISSYKLLIAGIYKLPLPSKYLSNKSLVWSDAPKLLNKKEINQLYSGEANKQIREDIERLAGGNLNTRDLRVANLTNEALFSYPIEDVLAMNGPGIYYFFNCRYVKGLKAKLSNFITRVLTDIKNAKNEFDAVEPQLPSVELLSSGPAAAGAPSSSALSSMNKSLEKWKLPGYERWASYKYQIYLQLSRFEEYLKTIHRDDALPEDKLHYLRDALLEGSFLAGNHELRGADPLSNNVLRSTYNNIKALKGPESEFILSASKFRHPVALLKRKHLQLFDEEFGPLLTRLPITRQLSNEGQARYTRAGGKRKDRLRRKTRRRRC